eukprot:5561362-Pyramimonas_sp.AAC.1
MEPPRILHRRRARHRRKQPGLQSHVGGTGLVPRVGHPLGHLAPGRPRGVAPPTTLREGRQPPPQEHQPMHSQGRVTATPSGLEPRDGEMQAAPCTPRDAAPE